MDQFEKLDQQEQRIREVYESRQVSKENIPMQPTRHQITVFGCIKTKTGWYRLGFDETRKALVPLEFLGED